jgi:FkbM family methyltransferase
MIFDLKQIQNVSAKKIRGAIHVGAFVGEELLQYRSLGLTNTILFEPQYKLFEIVKRKCILGERVFNIALGSENKQAEMFISDRAGGVDNGAGASSSILEPKHHLIEHPEVTFPDKETININRFDYFIENTIAEPPIVLPDYNFLNIDVQGYELEVLKGFGEHLSQIDIIICEVNRLEMYKNCPLQNEITNFLQKNNMAHAYTHWQSEGWGDSIYIRNN